MFALRQAPALSPHVKSFTPYRITLTGGVSVSHAAFDLDLASLPTSARWLRSPFAFVVMFEAEARPSPESLGLSDSDASQGVRGLVHAWRLAMS